MVRFTRPAAVLTACSLLFGLIAAGCGGGGGGGGGGGAPPPPPQQPSNNQPPTGVTGNLDKTEVVGGQESVMVSWDGNDPDGDTLTALIKPTPGSPLSFAPSSSTTSKSFSFSGFPAVATDTPTSVDIVVDDGHGHTVAVTRSITVKAPSGPPPPPPPNLNAVTSLDLRNCPVLTKTNNQVIEVFQNITGLDFSQLSVTVDGVAATTVRPFGDPASSCISYEVRLPRLDTPGAKTMVVSYPGYASVNTTVTYQDAGTSHAIFDYSDSSNRGRVVKVSTDAMGVASNVTDLIGGNGHNNAGFATGASRSAFWIAGNEVDGVGNATGVIRIFYADAAPGGTGVNFADVTDGATTTGVVQSIASLRNGSQAVIAWRDPLNSMGQGDWVWWITILQVNASGQPSVVRSFPLNRAGKESGINLGGGNFQPVQMTSVQVVEHMFQSGTAIGNGAKQDYALLGQLDGPFKLFMIPLEQDPNLDYFRFDLTVKPQVVEVFYDVNQKFASIWVVGQNGTGIIAQSMLLGATAPSGFGSSVGVAGTTRDALAAFLRNGNGLDVLIAVVGRGDSLYTLYSLQSQTNVATNVMNIGGATNNIQHVTRAPGNGWFALGALVVGGGSGADIVQPDFSRKQLPSLNTSNVITATEQHVFWEVRQSDFVIVDELVGNTVPQAKTEPLTNVAPGSGRAAASRSLAR